MSQRLPENVELMVTGIVFDGDLISVVFLAYHKRESGASPARPSTTSYPAFAGCMKLLQVRFAKPQSAFAEQTGNLLAKCSHVFHMVAKV